MPSHALLNPHLILLSLHSIFKPLILTCEILHTSLFYSVLSSPQNVMFALPPQKKWLFVHFISFFPAMTYAFLKMLFMLELPSGIAGSFL